MKSIQAEVSMWHREKFGADPEIKSAIMEKIGEECEELAEAHVLQWPENYSTHSMSKERLESEAADVAIALMAYCDRVGIDLEEAILKKMRVNWCREWKKIDGKYVRDKTS